MNKSHWIALAVVLIVGYVLGIKYPAVGSTAMAKVGL